MRGPRRDALAPQRRARAAAARPAAAASSDLRRHGRGGLRRPRRPTGAWCWLRQEHLADVIMRQVSLFLPLWAAVVYNGVVYHRVVRMLRFTMKVHRGDLPRPRAPASARGGCAQRPTPDGGAPPS